MAVADPQPEIGEDRGVQGAEVRHRGVVGRWAGHPAVGVDQDAAARLLSGRPVRGGQRRHHLAQCGAQRVVQSEGGVRALRGQDEQGACLVGGQPRDVRTEAGQQRDAAVPAAFGVDRDTGADSDSMSR